MDTSVSTPAATDPAALSWRLPDEDAWDIAMAWRTALQGHVQLITDCDGPADSIVQSYAWVRIDASGFIARAAIITWTALAACPGFSGSVNAAFWKRVFSELQEHRGGTQPLPGGPNGFRDKPVAITDAVGFLNQPGYTFPRFMGAAAHVWGSEFGGMFLDDESSVEADAQVAATLEALLARLRPFMRRVGPRQIDLCVRMRPQFDDGAVHAVTTAERVINDLAASMLGADVRFQVTHIMLEDDFKLSGEEEPRAFLAFVQQMPVRFRPFTLIAHLNDVTREARAQWLRGLLRLEGRGVLAQVSSFWLQRQHVSDTVFQTLLATLPFANSFEHDDLPWIAYAIFHPRAASSSWRHLTLDYLTITEHSRHVLSGMARGNNLLALLNGTPATSDAYYSTQLQSGTLVFGSPAALRDVVFSAPSVTLVDVCGISSLDASTLGDWVAVIVPAYGLGYVRPHELFGLRAHAPRSQRSLGLNLCPKYDFRDNRSTHDPPEVLLHMLSPLGAVVTSLNVASYKDMSRSTVHEVLCACPSLKMLVVSHTGKFWSHPIDDAFVVPRLLEELELRVDNHPRVAYPRVDYLQTSLRNLRALRISMEDTHMDTLATSRETFTTMLGQLPSLEYFHRRTRDDYSWMGPFPIPYANSAKWTEPALVELGLIAPTFLKSRVSQGACVAALISVLDHKQMPVVDRDLVSIIFHYVGDRQRWIHIEPNHMQDFCDIQSRSHYPTHAATAPIQTVSTWKRWCTEWIENRFVYLVQHYRTQTENHKT